MKKLLMLAAFIMVATTAFAKAPLSEASRTSEYVSIYKLDAKQVRSLFGENAKVINDTYLNNYQTKYKEKDDIPQLPRGNYVLVQAVDGKLNYTSHTVDDLQSQVVAGDELVVILYDSQGNMIEDAAVSMLYDGRLKFDKEIRAYKGTLIKNRRVYVEINNKGVLHYLWVNSRMGSNRNYSYNSLDPMFLSKESRRQNRIEKKALTGMMVYSKPMYKPGETVKFKAYITDRNKKPFNEPLEVRLISNSWSNELDTLLTVLRPYRKGGYTYEFKITDSLQMKLDNSYYISFVDRKDDERKINISNYFRYEDYELKGLTFNARLGKNEYYPGEDVILYMKAQDMNGLAQTDGRVQIDVSMMKESFKTKKDVFFVKNRNWSYTMPLDQSGEQKLTLPDSIFIDDISARYTVKVTWLSSDNEKHDKYLNFTRSYNTKIFSIEDTPNAVKIALLNGIDTVFTRAEVKYYNAKNKEIGSETITLPGSVSPGKLVEHFVVKADSVSNSYKLANYHTKYNNVAFYNEGERIKLEVTNPHGYPFIYRVWKGKKLVERGYSSDQELALSIKDNASKSYTAVVNVFAPDGFTNMEKTITRNKEELNLDVQTNTTVYPGQTVDVDMTVTDWKGKAVKDIDLTAYAVTSKFRSNPIVMPYWDKKEHVTLNLSFPYSYEKVFNRIKVKLEWDRWKEELGLSDNEFYQFLNPNVVNIFEQDTDDGITQIAPYVIVDGKIQGAQIVWIDNLVCYYRGNNNIMPYSFRVDHSKPHKIQVRTHDRIVFVNHFIPAAGKLNIISLNGDLPEDKTFQVHNSKYSNDGKISYWVLKNKIESDSLSVSEYNLLKNSLVAVNRNMGGRFINDDLNISRGGIFKKTYIVKDSNVLYLPAQIRRRYNYSSTAEDVLLGPIADGSQSWDSYLYVDDKLEGRYNFMGGNLYWIANDEVMVKPLPEDLFSRRIISYNIENPNFKEFVMTKERADSRYYSEIMSYLKYNSWSFEVRTENMENDSVPLSGQLLVYLNVEKNKDDLRVNVPLKPVLVKIESLDKDSPNKTLYNSYDTGRCISYKSYTEGEGRFRISVFNDDFTYVYRDVVLYPDGWNFVQFNNIEPTKDTLGMIKKELDFLQNNMMGELIAPGFGVKFSEPNLGVAVDGNISTDNLKNEVVTGIISNIEKNQNFVLVFDNKRILLNSDNHAFRIEAKKKRGFMDLYQIIEDTQEELHIAKIQFMPGYDYKLMIKKYYPLAFNPYRDYRPRNRRLRLENQNDMMSEKPQVFETNAFQRGYISFSGNAITYTADEMEVASSQNVFESLKSLNPEFTGGGNLEMDSDLGAKQDIGMGGAGNMSIADIISNAGLSLSANPLIIVNGSPYSGDLNSLDVSSIENVVVMDASKAVDLYGEQARGGVVIITMAQAVSDAASMSLRTNFRDDAFWQPTLSTDKDGKASFKVTYPDDITSWDAHFIAVGGKYNISAKDLNVRSFKALMAQLSLPRFAVEGDRFDALGRVSSYLGDTMELKREVYIDSLLSDSREISVVDSYVDKISVSTPLSDSLTLRYTIEGGGIFDGEERSLPIYRRGTLQTDGEFKVLNDAANYSFDFNAQSGDVIVNAETSSLEVFLREIEKLDEYGYLCNEQMASKVKALLMKRRMGSMFGFEFKGDKKILDLISKLNANKNTDGLWGWWNNSSTVLWISQQIVEAMLMAERDGFDTGLNRENLMWYMNNVLLRDSERYGRNTSTSENKQEYCRKLILIKELDPDRDISPYVAKLDDVADNSVYEKVLSMRVKQLAGQSIRLDSLMSWSRTTMLGGLYWSEPNRPISTLYRYLPQNDNVQTTLLAYKILRGVGGKQAEREKIRNYFFEIRKSGSWKNTYESANIMETIMPDMLDEEQTYTQAEIVVNGVQVDQFPYKTTLEGVEKVGVAKSGTAPVFFTAYQQSWNDDPQVENKGFEVKTSFDNGTTLKAGETVVLRVTVNANELADYVMIEIPIPAGCSYDSKMQNWWSREVHREHYKDRVSIFCSNLPKGETKFEIKLIPRFTGEYHLNPARAELMYFPVFYGRDAMKQVNIKD